MNIQELTTIPQLEQVQQLEMSVWGTPVIPIHQTLTAIKNGGIIVGAYDGEELIGFTYSFAGFKNGQSYLCSHMLAIDSNRRAQGIGEAIKQEQRRIAIDRGYDKMIWTYDPLETRNGYLNLTKLQAICDTYVENCYGEMQDGLNKGLPSDRFEVNWYLTSEYVTKKQRIDSSGAQAIVDYSMNEQGFPVLGEFDPQQKVEAAVYLVPVYADFQKLKVANPELALDWRYKTRSIFETLFAQGYAAIRLEKGKSLHHYVVVKKDLLDL